MPFAKLAAHVQRMGGAIVGHAGHTLAWWNAEAGSIAAHVVKCKYTLSQPAVLNLRGSGGGSLVIVALAASPGRYPLKSVTLNGRELIRSQFQFFQHTAPLGVGPHKVWNRSAVRHSPHAMAIAFQVATPWQNASTACLAGAARTPQGLCLHDCLEKHSFTCSRTSTCLMCVLLLRCGSPCVLCMLRPAV
jgi:hypothetical protein